MPQVGERHLYLPPPHGRKERWDASDGIVVVQSGEGPSPFLFPNDARFLRQTAVDFPFSTAGPDSLKFFPGASGDVPPARTTKASLLRVAPSLRSFLSCGPCQTFLG